MDKRTRMVRALEKRLARKSELTPAEEELIDLAAEPVPLRSGWVEFGTGPYCYVKVNRHDGSTRCFRFRSELATTCAMAVGMAADTLGPDGEAS